MTKVVLLQEADQALLDQYLELCYYAFDRPSNAGRREKFMVLAKHSHVFVLLDDAGQVKSGLMVTNLPVNWHGRSLLMAGIGYVATYPEFGGQGAISQLMQAAYAQMAQDGVYLSYLAPFSFRFYRRFGFEQVFDQVKYQLTAANFPRLPKNQTGSVVRADFSAHLPEMARLYQANFQSQQGGVTRPDWWQAYRFSKHSRWELALSKDETGELDGYLLYEREPGTEFRVVELMATSSAAQTRLWTFVGKHVSSYQSFSYTSSNQAPHNDWLPESYQVQTTIQPYMMAAVANWPALLANWQFTADLAQPITMTISDDFYPQNAGVWELTVTAGQGQLKPSAAEQVDLRIDTRQLTKVVLGYRSLRELQQAGTDLQADPATLDRLQASLTYPNKPMLWDYF
ncbi:enhanced intracellular survival protein Eis [Lapidilactobacillus achengensis]|uniref:Enhanced intracellular survival protein Eis n=1 Tax=Lapidilactobacillus achengensis TaxID=2486000 RepID=A0ABW1UK05_9LACO|nr:GNAT family N-acetyltransferase [Lapidilactobacillus achengensis]